MSTLQNEKFSTFPKRLAYTSHVMYKTFNEFQKNRWGSAKSAGSRTIQLSEWLITKILLMFVKSIYFQFRQTTSACSLLHWPIFIFGHICFFVWDILLIKFLRIKIYYFKIERKYLLWIELERKKNIGHCTV